MMQNAVLVNFLFALWKNRISRIECLKRMSYEKNHPVQISIVNQGLPSFHWVSSTNITSFSLELIRAQIIVSLTDSKEYLYIAVDNYSDGKNEANCDSKDKIQPKMREGSEFILLLRWHVFLKLPSTHAADNFAEEKRLGSEAGCDNPSDCNCFPGELLCPSCYRFQWIDDGEVAIDWHYHQKSNRSVQVQETRILDELVS